MTKPTISRAFLVSVRDALPHSCDICRVNLDYVYYIEFQQLKIPRSEAKSKTATKSSKSYMPMGMRIFWQQTELPLKSQRRPISQNVATA